MEPTKWRGQAFYVDSSGLASCLSLLVPPCLRLWRVTFCGRLEGQVENLESGSYIFSIGLLLGSATSSYSADPHVQGWHKISSRTKAIVPSSSSTIVYPARSKAVSTSMFHFSRASWPGQDVDKCHVDVSTAGTMGRCETCGQGGHWPILFLHSTAMLFPRMTSHSTTRGFPPFKTVSA